jgi:hypothetical protein
MFSIFRNVRRRPSLARAALLFILASFVFVGSASAGDVFGVPPAPTPPPGPDDFTDAEVEPTVVPGPDDFTDAEVEPTVAPGPDDFTSADPDAPDPDDGFGVPADAGEPFDAGDDGPAPVGLVAALPATGTGALAEPGDRDLTPLLVLVAAACVLATGLLRSGGDGGNRWGSA